MWNFSILVLFCLVWNQKVSTGILLHEDQMIRIYVPRPYKGPYPVGNCSCGKPTSCQKDGKFRCSECQWFDNIRRKQREKT